MRLECAGMIEVVPAGQRPAQPLCEPEARPVGVAGADSDAVQTLCGFVIREPAPSPEIGRHRPVDAQAGHARGHRLLGAVRHPEKIGASARDEPKLDIVPLESRAHQRRRHRLGAARVVGDELRTGETFGQLGGGGAHDGAGSVQIVRRDYAGLEVAIGETCLDRNGWQRRFFVAVAGLDDLALADDLIDGSWFAGARVAIGAEEAHMAGCGGLDRLEDRLMGAADGTEQNGLSYGLHVLVTTLRSIGRAMNVESRRRVLEPV